MNAAGTPEVTLKLIDLPDRQPEQPIVDDEIDKQLAQKLNDLQLAEEEESWNQVEVNKREDDIVTDISYTSLRSSDLALKSKVNVRNINHPFDFVVTS